MDKKKILPTILVASLTTEALLVLRHPDALGPEPHTELEFPVRPSATTVSVVSASGGSNVSAKLEIWNSKIRS